MGGFLKNSETQRIKDLWVFKNSNTSWSLKFGVAEGNIESDDITLDEFLND